MKPLASHSRLSLFPICLALMMAFFLIPIRNPVRAASAAGDDGSPLEVSSPLWVNFEIDCEQVSTYQLTLSDNQRNIIARQLLDPKCEGRGHQLISTKLFFDLFEQPSRTTLSLSTKDHFGRTVMLVSREIVLTGIEAPSTVNFDESPYLRIFTPSSGETISAHIFNVAGQVEITSQNHFTLGLIDETGKTISHQVIYFPAAETEDYYNFETTLSLPLSIRSGNIRLTLMYYDTFAQAATRLVSIPIQIDLN